MSTPRYIGQVEDVRQEAAFDEYRLHEYLEGVIPGYAGPLTVKQFQGGQSNPTYLLVTPDRKFVLRRKPPGVLLKSAHAVDREYHVIAALSSTDVPVPKVYTLCEDESVIGTMFYVMDLIEGRIFWDCTMPGVDRDERRAIFDSVNETLAALHSVDYEAIGLRDFGRPGNYFERQVSRWSRQYNSSRTKDIPEMDRLIDWFPGALPADDGKTCIVHGDYSFHNVLIHPTDPRVVGVIDWELSTIGHPLGDLMYHAMEWYRPPGVDSRGTLRDRDLEELGIPSLREYIARYCERTGFCFDDNFAVYRAFNLFRVAAILQGIAGRVQEGTATSTNAEHIIRLIKPLADAAWSEAKAAGAG